MSTKYDREHIDSVLRRFGMPKDQRTALLAELRFPIDRDTLEAFLAPLGITKDALINSLGGSP